MTAHRLFVSSLLFALGMGIGQSADAQVRTKEHDVGPTVFLNHIEAVFPGAYFPARKPSPPVLGYYAWKLVFGEDGATVVFRTDSAIASSDDRRIARAGALYLCESASQPILACAKRIKGSARVSSASVTVEISDTTFVLLVRRLRPSIVTRQWFEPGGRFRVDQLTISYREPHLR